MTDKIVEVMARAAADVACYVKPESPKWADLHPDVQALFIGFQRAALKALSERGYVVVPREPRRLWLWKNGDHYVAFDHLYPTRLDCGDPSVLGEPAAWATWQPSRGDERDNDPTIVDRALNGIKRGWRALNAAEEKTE